MITTESVVSSEDDLRIPLFEDPETDDLAFSLWRRGVSAFVLAGTYGPETRVLGC